MKKIPTILSLLFCMMLMNAQGIIKKVNDIKMSDDYMWEQYAHPDADSALVKAIEWFTKDVNCSEGVELSSKDISPHIKHIFLRGSELIRAFVYMKKADIKNIVNGLLSVRNPNMAGNETNVWHPDSLTLSLMAQKDIYAVRDYFENAILQGDIVRYGSPKATGSMNNLHLILFSHDNLAPNCVLSPVIEGMQRRNLLNGQKDSLDNYHRCYAIWYEIKEIK